MQGDREAHPPGSQARPSSLKGGQRKRGTLLARKLARPPSRENGKRSVTPHGLAKSGSSLSERVVYEPKPDGIQTVTFSTDTDVDAPPSSVAVAVTV